ncbi:hypothetical protein [Dysgonomonas massiliensis]|uniref:hypothetical protein n=1 Tax=Dysgonomonas massiliensis TaxID=2040292 RepID=UPI0011AF11E7|nr:hypothetical protein [Dysgonomonas massiliensis]
MKTIYYLKFIVLFLIISSSCTTATDKVNIRWADLSEQDFSFASQWSYAEYIIINQYNQPIQDGITYPEIERMMDENGEIKNEYLSEYYQLVDTTHQYHTIECTSNAPQFYETNFIEVRQIATNEYGAATLMNVSSHASLHISIIDNKCHPSINLTSINPEIDFKVTLDKNNSIIIDKRLLEKDTLKAVFEFNFKDNTNNTIWWKGKILAPISKAF